MDAAPAGAPPPRRADFRHFSPIRVRYSEIDAQGIVFNAHYLTYFDIAVTEYLRALDYDYDGMVKATGLDFHLAKSVVEYKRPIVKDAQIEVGIVASRIGRTSLTWGLGIFLAGQDDLLATGEIVWVCSKVGAHKSHPLPDDMVQVLSPPPPDSVSNERPA